MAKQDDGGPAYPSPALNCTACDGSGTETVGDKDILCRTCDGIGCVWKPGMSLRAYFAGQAMQGLLSNPHATVEMDRDAARMGVLPRNHAVAVAEGYADALLYRLRTREAEDG